MGLYTLLVVININYRGSPWALLGHRGGEDKHARDTAFLNSYADKQWEVSIQFLYDTGY